MPDIVNSCVVCPPLRGISVDFNSYIHFVEKRAKESSRDLSLSKVYRKIWK